MTRILLSAHKGGPEDCYIPNSLGAVNAIRDSGVDLIEFDVRISKDNKFVTLHDEEIVINGAPRKVERLKAADILQYAEGACMLEDMLTAVKDHAIAHVDIKDTRLEIGIVDMCEAILGKNGYIITTLEDKSVRKIRRARPDVQVALSLGRDVRGMNIIKAAQVRFSEIFPARRVAACDPTMLALNYRIARLGVLNWAWNRNLPVLLWTINTPELMEKAWANPHIWAFTTNYPREALMKSHHHAKVGRAKTVLARQV